MKIDGDAVLGFIAAVEKAMDDGGVGQHRAFRMLRSLKSMGLSVTADEMPPGALDRVPAPLAPETEEE